MLALRDRRGAAIVEFALVAAPLVFFLFAIVESGLVFVASLDLSNATATIARQIRTGAIMAQGSSATTSGAVLSLSDFKAAICKKMSIVPTTTCTTQLQVDVRAPSTARFGSGSSASTPVSNGNFATASLCFYSGASGSVVEFRAFYLWPISTPLLLSALVNASSYTVGTTTTNGNYHVIVSSEAFKIEQNLGGANSGSGC